MTFVVGEKNSRRVDHIFYLSTDKWAGHCFINDGSNIIEKNHNVASSLVVHQQPWVIAQQGVNKEEKIFFLFERVEEEESEIMVLFVQGVVSIL